MEENNIKVGIVGLGYVGIPLAIAFDKKYKTVGFHINKENIEKYSIMRSLLAIERADVCLMMIDAVEGVTDQDAKIAGEAHEAGKGVIIVVNKWDAVEKETGTLEAYKKEIYQKLKYLSYAPIIFISAKTRTKSKQII